MGYYSGTGVTSGGGEDVSIAQTLLVGTTLNVFRKDIVTTNRKSGVSLANAQGAHCSISTSNGDLTWGSWAVPMPNRSGTIVKTSYSQIGDSNLYELVTETDEFHHKLNSSNWDS